MFVKFVFSFFLAGMFSFGAAASGASPIEGEDLVGVWACQSMNAGAYTGRPCPTQPRLQMEVDHNYTWGQERGTWKYENEALTLSKRTGKGRLNADGKLIYEYELNGKQYVLTLYRRRQ